MEKKTFLGIDCTPRKALWAEIKRLNKQIEIQEQHLSDGQIELNQLKRDHNNLSNRNGVIEMELQYTKSKLEQKIREIDNLRSRLTRFKPQRYKEERFTKKK